MSLLLLGENRARHRGEWLPARQALEIAGLQPFTLAAKEGLALLNGTQVSTAYALRGLFEAEDLMSAALVCGGLSVEAMLARARPSIRASTRRAASAARSTWPPSTATC